jgi:hypothetical protein
MITDFTGGTVNARPNIICDPGKNSAGLDSTGSAYVINVGCFSVPGGLGQIGNMQRNPVRLPAVFNNDLAFFKKVKFGESREIQFRWEMYNIFNRANFDDIDGSMAFGLVQVNPNPGQACTAAGNSCTAIVRQTRSSFGTPSTARTPRVMQASLRINF